MELPGSAKGSWPVSGRNGETLPWSLTFPERISEQALHLFGGSMFSSATWAGWRLVSRPCGQCRTVAPVSTVPGPALILGLKVVNVSPFYLVLGPSQVRAPHIRPEDIFRV